LIKRKFEIEFVLLIQKYYLLFRIRENLEKSLLSIMFIFSIPFVLLEVDKIDNANSIIVN